MAVDEARRLALQPAARSTWNPEVAVTLMELLPPTGWGDVATRQHVDTRLDALEQRLELRIDGRIDSLEHKLRTEIAQGTNRAILWTVGTMMTLAGVTVTAVGLFTRLG